MRGWSRGKRFTFADADLNPTSRTVSITLTRLLNWALRDYWSEGRISCNTGTVLKDSRRPDIAHTFSSSMSKSRNDITPRAFLPALLAGKWIDCDYWLLCAIGSGALWNSLRWESSCNFNSALRSATLARLPLRAILQNGEDDPLSCVCSSDHRHSLRTSLDRLVGGTKH